MVDVVERSAVYEMLDKIQQDVCEGYGFQLDKWVEYVDAMKCEKERIMTTEKFNNAYALFTKVGNTETKIKQLVKLKKFFPIWRKPMKNPKYILMWAGSVCCWTSKGRKTSESLSMRKSTCLS